jgi:hypothetical protein
MFLTDAVKNVIVQKKYVTVMLLRAYRAAELCVNMLMDKIEMDNEEWTALFYILYDCTASGHNGAVVYICNMYIYIQYTYISIQYIF